MEASALDSVLFIRGILLFSKRQGPPSSYAPRYAVLRDLEGSIALFEVENGKPSKFQSNSQLYGCKVVDQPDSDTPSFSSFYIEFPDGKRLFLAAEDKQERSKWVSALRQIIAIAPEISEMEINKLIDKALIQERKSKAKHPNTVLLLLGPGGSGKSTVVKQIKILCNKGFTKAEKDFFKYVCNKNIVDTMKQLLEINKSASIGLSTGSEAAATRFLEWAGSNSNPLQSNNPSSAANVTTQIVPPDIVDCLQSLWQDPLINNATMSIASVHLDGSPEYFLKDIGRVTRSDFSPSEEDILRCRYRTTAVHETEFISKGHLFRIVDVGGQRGERKKWVDLFTDVTAIIFVAAISEYDQKLMEDGETNRLTETLDVFNSICSLKAIQNTPIILMLNKDDLFREKIKHVPLTVCFPNYKGSNSHAEASEFILQQFDKRKHTSRAIYPHFTCATDTKSFESVLSAVTDIIMRDMLEEQFF